jgi:ribosomal protein S18 acetylase RimI-like enzyme
MSEASRMPVDHALSRKVQENFATYFRIFDGLPGIIFVDDAVTWTSSQGLPGSFVLSTQLSGPDADARIVETLCRIGQHVDEVDWLVFPSCRPTDLGYRLIAYNEVGRPDGEWELYGDIGGPGGNWMLADLNTLPGSVSVPEGFHIMRVRSHTMLDEWIEINARGFGVIDYGTYHAGYARHGFDDDALVSHYIGYMDGEPVTSSTLLVAGGSASVYNISTPEALRRQGFGRAITHATLKAAVQRGYDWSWLWSSSLGISVYASLGFVMADFGIREYQWRKRT